MRLFTFALGMLAGHAVAKPQETKRIATDTLKALRKRTGSPTVPADAPSGAATVGDSFPASDPPSSWAGHDVDPRA